VLTPLRRLGKSTFSRDGSIHDVEQSIQDVD